MTMFKREMIGPASRYNARKRELQASMLQYTERVRTINGLQEKNFMVEHSPRLDTRSRRQHVSLLDGPDHSSTPTQERRIRQRPHSLDDKELLRNKKLNQSLLKASRRNAKSEYGHPIVIPTDTSPGSNLYDSSPKKTNGDRLNFVTTSDCYDLAELRQNSTSFPKHRVSRVTCGEEGMKLIEQIDMRSRRERKTAWGSSDKNKDETSVNGKPDCFGGFITVKSIKTKNKNKNNLKLGAVVNDPEDNISINSKRTAHAKQRLPYMKSADKNEIYPLNVLLETVLSSCKDPLGKLRQRPKRARRMQLHKPNLVMIPEDGGTASSSSLDKASQCHTHNNRYIARQCTPIPSIASLSAIKEGHKKHHKEAKNFSEKDFEYVDNNNNDMNDALISEESGRLVNKQKKKRQNGQKLDSIIVNNSILYPTLPWENGHLDMDTSLISIDRHDSTDKHKKVKRLVFLTDQPENSYRR